MNDTTTPAQRLAAALSASGSSDRLQAAMTAGTHPDPSFAEPLIARCAIEPDFAVREMLTWALIQLPRDAVLTRLTAELLGDAPQAQSQALHTLSKLGDERAWPAITEELLRSEHDGVARTAWRAAVALAPAEAHPGLAALLLAQLGRGDTDVMRSLSRALVALAERGAEVAAPLEAARLAAAAGAHAAALAHAEATARLLDDPDASFALDPVDARRLGIAHAGSRGAH